VSNILHSDNPDQYRDQEADGRFYHWDGDQYLSVTTALKLGLPSGYLMKWYAKIVAEHVVDNWDGLAAAHGEVDADEIVRHLKAQPNIVRDAAGDLGSLVHELCEQYVLTGEVPPEGQYDRAIIRRLNIYINWIETMKPHFLAVEGVCYNRRHRYAGTFDMIVDLPGYGRVIVDIKTGKGVYGSAALQQTAYRRAEFIAVGDQEIPMPKTRGAMILHLQKTQWRLLPVETRPASWTAFLHALHTAYWIAGTGEGTERTAVGQPLEKGRPT
jgi:hypothetical protein